MDLLILISIASTVLVLLLTLLYFRAKDDKTQKKGPQQQQQQQPQRPVPLRAQEGIPRRAQIARNQRLRTANALGAAGGPNAANNRQQQQQQQNDLLLPNNNNNIDNVDDSDEDNARAIPDFGDEKMGAKKRAKLEAKAEKKNQREHELKIREDRKKQEAMQTENRRKLEEKERIEELQREEAERLAREERERKELEEYLKMKQAFSVEEEGYDDDDDGGDDADNDAKNLLQAFIDYIKTNKVVYLEDLAIAFQLKTTAVIERIQTLQEQGILTGVIDDRGKFIYIAEEELEAVAKFIRQRGRVSITELAECSNKLVIVIPPTITEGSVV